MIPHFKFPFALSPNGKRAMYVDQDSDDEVMDSVEIILSTVQGERIEMPTYGIPDYVFVQGGVDAENIQAIVRLMETRADTSVIARKIEDATQHVHVEVRRRDIG